MLTVLDGSMGHELKLRGLADGTFMPGLVANIDHPADVTAVHAEYVAVGADVITTNSFVATRSALRAHGREAELATLLHAATRCARDAADAAPRPVLVAGCVPPLRECYHPELVSRDRAVMIDEYAAICAELAPRVDLFLCETLSTIAEAEAACAATAPLGKPTWLGLTLTDDETATLRGGESVCAALDAVRAMRHAPPTAVLFNCSAPQAVTAALRSVAGHRFGGGAAQLGAYANGFRVTTSRWLEHEAAASSADGSRISRLPELTLADEYDADGRITPAAYRRHADTWAAHGAQIIGGCCGVGPAHIAQIDAMRRH